MVANRWNFKCQLWPFVAPNKVNRYNVTSFTAAAAAVAADSSPGLDTGALLYYSAALEALSFLHAITRCR